MEKETDENTTSTDKITPREPVSSIDDITLELLINKNRYQRYLSKKDPEKYKEIQEYYAKVKLYSDDIQYITNKLIENPKTAFSVDITEFFERFTKSCIQYLENKELENREWETKEFTATEEEEENLFQNMDMKEPEPSKSFWGERIVKKNHSNAFTMDMFINQHKYKN
jgi:hypothetical protein